MLSGVEVFGGVLILGRVAAAHMATHETHSQVNPAVAHLQALLAPFGVGMDIVNLIEMRALRHVFMIAKNRARA
jgi:hypothetical protein